MDVSQITALIGAAASLLCTVVVGALTFFMKKTLARFPAALLTIPQGISTSLISRTTRHRTISASCWTPSIFMEPRPTAT